MKQPITYLIWNTKQCGGNVVIFEHVNRLYERGYPVKLLSIAGGKPEWFDLKMPVISYISTEYIKKHSIVVATFWPTVFIALFMRANKKFHLIQGWDEDTHRNIILRKIAKYSLKLKLNKIVVSNYLKQKIKKLTKSSEVIFKIDDCQIDTTIFKPAKKRDRKIEKKVKILSVVSRYYLNKGPDLLIKIIEHLKKKYSNYEFILVSFEKEPPAKIIDKFFSNPPVKDLVRLYNEADVLLVTSRIEGFFIPGLEAMACGCPVVTTDSQGIKEYAIHGENAIVVKVLSDIWKKDVIEKFIKDKRLKNKIITNGFKTVRKYKWKNIIDDLEKILVGGKRSIL